MKKLSLLINALALIVSLDWPAAPISAQETDTPKFAVRGDELAVEMGTIFYEESGSGPAIVSYESFY